MKFRQIPFHTICAAPTTQSRKGRARRPSPHSEDELLLNGLRGLRCRGNCGCCLLALFREVVAVPEILVELAGQLRGARAKSRPAAFKEEDRHNAALRRVGVGDEPAKASAF